MSDKPIVVIGGGLAGLSAALTLQEAGRAVEIFEGSDRVGGRVASDHIDGFTLDRGFQLINANYPELKRLDVIRGLDFQTASRSIDISLGDERYSLSDPRSNPFSALNSKTGTFLEKLKFAQYLINSAQNEKSVGEELEAAGTLYTRVLRPFLSGVFLADPEQIGAVQGKELIRSFISGKPGLPRLGAGALPAIMAKKIEKIHLNSQVDSIAQFSGHEIIVATDLTTSAQLLDIPNVPKLASCTTWYHEIPADFSDSNRLLLDGEKRGPVLNSIVISNFIPSYAPAGRSLLSTTTIEHTSESEVRRHLALLWGRETQSWPLIAKYEIPKALPIFAPGSTLATTSKITDGVFIAGDFRTAASQNGALLSGRLAAQELLNQ
jgi:hypothetical protein